MTHLSLLRSWRLSRTAAIAARFGQRAGSNCNHSNGHSGRLSFRARLLSSSSLASPRQPRLSPWSWRSATKPFTHAQTYSTDTARRRFSVDWRYYAAQFKEKPGSHLTAFLVLHEFTAIAPLGLVYYGLSWLDVHIPFPQSVLDESNAKIKRVIKYYGWDIEPDSRVMVNMVAAYGIVKMLLPVRIAASVMLTPSLAKVLDRVVVPLRNRLRGIVGKQ